MPRRLETKSALAETGERLDSYFNKMTESMKTIAEIISPPGRSFSKDSDADKDLSPTDLSSLESSAAKVDSCVKAEHNERMATLATS